MVANHTGYLNFLFKCFNRNVILKCQSYQAKIANQFNLEANKTEDRRMIAKHWIPFCIVLLSWIVLCHIVTNAAFHRWRIVWREMLAGILVWNKCVHFDVKETLIAKCLFRLLYIFFVLGILLWNNMINDVFWSRW